MFVLPASPTNGVTAMDRAHHRFGACLVALFLVLIGVIGELGAASAQTAPGATSPAPIQAGMQRNAADGTSITLLSNGKWLLLGGQQGGLPRHDAWLFDPETRQVTSLAFYLAIARSGHTATLLPDGNVLVLGGLDASGAPTSTTELIDLQANTVRPISLGLIPRSEHSATLALDGRLVIAGGLDAKDDVLTEVEVLNTFTWEIEHFDAELQTARFAHLAELMANSPVLLSGGYDDDNRTLTTGEMVDLSAGRTALVLEPTPQPKPTESATAPAVAASIPAASAVGVPADQVISIRFSIPLDVRTVAAANVTLFGPSGPESIKSVVAEGGRLLFVTPSKTLLPESFYTLFVRDAKGVNGLALPFTTIGFKTGPAGAGQESGQARVKDQPVATMSATARASSLAMKTESSGSAHADGVPQGVTVVPDSRPSWQPAPPVADDELWTPGQAQFSGRWQYGGPTPTPNAALPTAAAGITALAGEVRRLNGAPMANVTLRIGSHVATTGHDGTFLVESVADGEQVLTIDGSTANQGAAARYGIYDVRIMLAPAQTTKLPYVIWMPKLDPRGNVAIPSPTTRDTVVTNPAIPGLELHLPAGTVIRDRNGALVTEINITAIPVDRPPFPLPEFNVPVYFTIQPGGAVLQTLTGQAPAGAQLMYPNYAQEVPRALAAFWNYDAYGKAWYVYGMGTVSADALQVVPDPGVTIQEFSGAMINNDPAPPPGNPPEPCDSCPCNPGDPPPPGGGDGDGDWAKDDDGGDPPCPNGGDPVSVSTGQFTHTERDLWLPDVMPLDIKRTYRNLDLNVRSFGVGMSHPYNMFLWSAQQYQQADLILPSGTRVHYVRTSPGTGWSDAVFGTQAPGQWAGSIIAWNGNGWNLTFRDGRFWRFGENKPMQDMTDRNGNKIIITRRDSGGTSGPITRLDSPNGRSIIFTLNAAGLVTAATDNSGRAFTYSYDAYNQLTSVTDPNGGVRIYTWDVNHHLVSIRDPNGNTIVQNVYDANARVTQQTEADGSTFTYAYTLNGNGKVTRTDLTDRRGNIRRVDFDANGYIVTNTFPLGKPEQQLTRFNVDPITGWLLSKTDALGRMTSYTYDSLGNRTSVTSLSGTSAAVTTSFTYTPTSNQISTVTDPLGHVTNFTYDSKGNLTQIIDPNGNSRTLTYDGQGRVLTIADGLGSTTTLSYSGPDLAGVTDPLGQMTSLFTDSIGRMISLRDPLGNFWRSNYDSLNRRTTTIDPLGNTIGYAYDANGKLLTFADARGGVTTFTFSNQSKATSRKDALNNTETYAYNAAGKISQVIDRKGLVRGYAYDNLGRRTQIGFGATISNPTSYQTTVGYTYDAGNRVTQILDSTNGTISRAYDGLNRITQEQTPLGTVSYTYDTAGRRTTMSVTGQLTTMYSYDNGNRLTQIARGSETVAFTYDAADRRTRTTLSNGVVVSYGYDNAGQLISIRYQKGATTIGTMTYAYDNAGRKIGVGGSLSQINIPQAVASAVYNANNQLMSWGGQGYTYDLNGNLTSDGARTYGWNARGELTSLAGAATASFQYDGFGRRQSKAVNGTNTQYVYDGPNFVQELAGGVAKANLVTGLGPDEVFSRTQNAITSSLLADGLGNIVALADGSGVVTTNYAYEPYGFTTSSGAPSENSQQFMAKENDGTGMMYHGPRYYLPECGRFSSEDPLAAMTGSGNAYRYAYNNPLSSPNPLGDLNTVTSEAKPIANLPAPIKTPILWVIRHSPFGGGCEAMLAWQAGSSQVEETFNGREDTPEQEAARAAAAFANFMSTWGGPILKIGVGVGVGAGLGKFWARALRWA